MLRTISGMGLALMLAACGGGESPPAEPPSSKPEASARPRRAPTGSFEVTALQLGTALGPDGRVAEPAQSLSRGGTIFAVVESEGRASDVELTVRWTRLRGQLGQRVAERTQTISPSGPAATVYEFAETDEWPAGEYQVEAYVGGDVALLRSVTVE